MWLCEKKSNFIYCNSTIGSHFAALILYDFDSTDNAVGTLYQDNNYPIAKYTYNITCPEGDFSPHKTYPNNFCTHTLGDINKLDNCLVRIQSACKWGIEFGSQHCDSRWQLEKAKELITQEGAGIIIYAYDQGGKAVGLRNHSLVYAEGQARELELVVDAYTQPIK